MTSTATSRRTASSPAPVRSCSAGLAASHAALPAEGLLLPIILRWSAVAIVRSVICMDRCCSLLAVSLASHQAQHQSSNNIYLGATLAPYQATRVGHSFDAVSALPGRD